MLKMKKAEMGMGTLIVFIALILVAAVAAGVLISTMGSIQNKALATGKSTATEVGTSLAVQRVYGEDGSDQKLENFTSIVKLNAGSESIRFNDLLVTMSLQNTSGQYVYDSGSSCDNVAANKYAVGYLINGTNNKAGYLTKGDVVKLCFSAPRAVAESERLSVSFIPKVGSTRVVETSLPDLMVDKRIDVFP